MEVELKLEVEPTDADALAASPLFADGAARLEALVSVYFDAPAQELRDAGFALRVRHIGERRVQTVKADGTAAAGLFARPEWERDIAGDTPELGDGAGPLATMVSADVLARIAPAFRTEVRRRIADVAIDDALIELVLDQGEILAGDRALAICEIELELKRGSTANLFALARTLDEAAPVRLGVLGKSERGYRLAGGEGGKPVKVAPVMLDGEMTAAAAFQAIAASCIRQYRLNEALLLREQNAGALHQARVGLRRLRSAFALFRPVVADAACDRLRGELKWIAGLLGEARDLDVLIAAIGDEPVLARLREARRDKYAGVTAALSSVRLRRLMLDLAEWLALGPWLTMPALAEARGAPATAFAADVFDRYRKRVKRRGRDLRTLDDEARHRLRIEAKKLRYATEFFSSLYGGKKAGRRQKAFLAAMEELQAHLGALNDQATAPLVLAELGLMADPAAIAAAADPKRRRALLVKAEEAHDALVDARRFWR